MKKKTLGIVMFVVLSLVFAGACNDDGGAPAAPVADTDMDLVPDASDNCPFVSNPGQEDSNSDGEGDVCQGKKNFADADSDGIEDGKDNCPYSTNPDQADTDGNGIGDACPQVGGGGGGGGGETDSDGDGVPDSTDNCVAEVNPDQALCAAKEGAVAQLAQACDKDCDGVDDVKDNCKANFNPDQKDELKTDKTAGANGTGDVCEDYDVDQDGVPDETDNCQQTANADQKDLDADTIGDVCDADIDGDKYNNDVEITAGTKPNDAGDFPTDLDGDKVFDQTDTNADGDKYDLADGDCNDLDKNVYPGQTDAIDISGKDTNCDGVDGNIGNKEPEGLIVAPNGVDKSGCGVNIQSPCKTIGYAVGLATNTLKSVKYLLVATAGDNKTFTENVALPASLSLLGGYCSAVSGSYITKYNQEAVTAFATRKRDLINCMPVIEGTDLTKPTISVSGAGVGVIEGLNVVSTGYHAIDIDGANAPGTSTTIQLNQIDALFAGVYVKDSKTSVIQKNYHIKAGVVGAINTEWMFGIKAEKVGALTIADNDKIEVVGKKVKAIGLYNVFDAKVDDNNPISVTASGEGYGVYSELTKKLQVSENGILLNNADANGLPVDGKVGGLFAYGDYGNVDFNDNHVVGCGVFCSAKASVYGLVFGDLSNIVGINRNQFDIVEKSGTGFSNALVVDFSAGPYDEAEVGHNNVEVSGSSITYGMLLNGKTTNAHHNKVHIVSKAKGLAGGIGIKNDGSRSILKDNKVFMEGGDDLTGVYVKALNSTPTTFVNLQRNAFIIGDVSRRGGAAVFEGSDNSIVDDNLFYGGRLKDGAKGVVGIQLRDMSPDLRFNTIIGGSIEDEGFGAALAADGVQPARLKLSGNILSVMSVNTYKQPEECHKYGIYMTDVSIDPASEIKYNFFHSAATSSEGKFNDQDYYGMCFVLKSVKDNIEEQIVGNINYKDANSKFADVKGNKNAPWKIGGGFSDFIFYVNELISDQAGQAFLTLDNGVITKDLLGNERILNGAVDIGAIEFGTSDPVHFKIMEE